jgi:hypothetical protein
MKILNLEIKNEKGAGGADPYMENVAYYVHFWAERGGPTRHCCPSLLVELAGQEIGLSGAVWNQFPSIQPLSDNVPFLNATQDVRLRLRQARLISAIRISVEKLIGYYHKAIQFHLKPFSHMSAPLQTKRALKFDSHTKNVCDGKY